MTDGDRAFAGGCLIALYRDIAGEPRTQHTPAHAAETINAVLRYADSMGWDIGEIVGDAMGAEFVTADRIWASVTGWLRRHIH
jgi:hypothetical protein